MNKEKRVVRVSLSATDFARLVSGEIVEREPMVAPKIEIALQDIGFAKMHATVDEAFSYSKTLNPEKLDPEKP